MQAVRTCVLAAATAALLALAPQAQAAFERAPVALGPGDGGSPSAVVDDAGTAHVVWGIAEELIGYCALPRGARACARSATLALDGRAGRPTILRRPQDGALFVVAGREALDDDPDESVWAFSSADGVAWSGPVPIGVGIGGALDAAVLTADGLSVDLLESTPAATCSSARRSAGRRAPRCSTSTTAPTARPACSTTPATWRGCATARTLALLGSPADGFGYRVLKGADPFADASWLPWPAKPVTRQWDEPRGAAGPRGAFVMYGVPILDQAYGAAPQVVRRLRARGWGRPRGLFYEVGGEHGVRRARAGRPRTAPRRGGRLRERGPDELHRVRAHAQGPLVLARGVADAVAPRRRRARPSAARRRPPRPRHRRVGDDRHAVGRARPVARGGPEGHAAARACAPRLPALPALSPVSRARGAA